MFLITGPVSILSSSCFVNVFVGQTQLVARHSRCIASARSTRCQLKLGLINKFMRCRGFVGVRGHRGAGCWIQTKCHRSPVVFLRGRPVSRCRYKPACVYCDVHDKRLSDLFVNHHKESERLGFNERGKTQTHNRLQKSLSGGKCAAIGIRRCSILIKGDGVRLHEISAKRVPDGGGARARAVTFKCSVMRSPASCEVENWEAHRE